MKALKITYKILLIVSFSFLAFSIFLHIVSYGAQELSREESYGSLIMEWRIRLYIIAIIALFIGFALCFVNKKLANVLGLSLIGTSNLIFVMAYTIAHYIPNNDGYGLVQFDIFIGVLLVLMFFTFIATVVLYAVIEKVSNKPVKELKEDTITE